ncbi:hypothetical protein HZP56_10940 [Elizabethkingia anophelis]|nr:hypothetical protein [Elizabethkingia anophelis]MCT4177348.1 hypothetical protein [Elizabethkingia anophelis]
MGGLKREQPKTNLSGINAKSRVVHRAYDTYGKLGSESKFILISDRIQEVVKREFSKIKKTI